MVRWAVSGSGDTFLNLERVDAVTVTRVGARYLVVAERIGASSVTLGTFESRKDAHDRAHEIIGSTEDGRQERTEGAGSG